MVKVKANSDDVLSALEEALNLTAKAIVWVSRQKKPITLEVPDESRWALEASKAPQPQRFLCGSCEEPESQYLSSISKVSLISGRGGGEERPTCPIIVLEKVLQMMRGKGVDPPSSPRVVVRSSGAKARRRPL